MLNKENGFNKYDTNNISNKIKDHLDFFNRMSTDVEFCIRNFNSEKLLIFIEIMNMFEGKLVYNKEITNKPTC